MIAVFAGGLVTLRLSGLVKIHRAEAASIDAVISGALVLQVLLA